MKYALIDKNQIQVGPRDWHYGFFYQYLADNQVDTSLLPLQEPTEPLQITKDIKVLPVEEPTTPAHNALTEQLAGPFLTITDTKVTGYYDVVDRPLDAAKNDLKAKVATMRYNKEVGGTKLTIQKQEVSVDTDRNGRNIWFQALMLLPEGSTQKFKFPEGWLDLTKADIGTIVAAIMKHVQDAFDWESSEVELIEVATTKEDVEGIQKSLDESIKTVA